MIGEKKHLASEKKRRNQIRTGFRHLVLLVPALRQHLEESGQVSSAEVNEAYLEAMFEKDVNSNDDRDIIGGHQISKSTILGASAEFIEIVEKKQIENVQESKQLQKQLYDTTLSSGLDIERCQREFDMFLTQIK